MYLKSRRRYCLVLRYSFLSVFPKKTTDFFFQNFVETLWANLDNPFLHLYFNYFQNEIKALMLQPKMSKTNRLQTSFAAVSFFNGLCGGFHSFANVKWIEFSHSSSFILTPSSSRQNEQLRLTGDTDGYLTTCVSWIGNNQLSVICCIPCKVNSFFIICWVCKCCYSIFLSAYKFQHSIRVLAL